jgi:hypothetical protein
LKGLFLFIPFLQRRMPSGMVGDKTNACDTAQPNPNPNPDPQTPTDNTNSSPQLTCASPGAGGEGSLRTNLLVTGPGVPAGAVSDAVLGLADVLPTVADLADISAADPDIKHFKWSGQSFASVLVPGRQQDKQQQQQQQDRVLFTLAITSKQCAHAKRVMSQLLPDLGPDRCVELRIGPGIPSPGKSGYLARRFMRVLFLHIRDDRI